MWRRRETDMQRTVRRTLVALSTVGLAAGGSAIAQERSKHVLLDAATGAIKPAKLTIQTAGGTVTRPMPFFSTGPLKAAAILARFGPGGDEEALIDASSDAALASGSGGQTQNTIGC